MKRFERRGPTANARAQAGDLPGSRPVSLPAKYLVSCIRLVAFDLDETLAPSKGAIDPRMAGLLRALLGRVEVAIISGAPERQLLSKVVARLDGASEAELDRLHLLPTCGTRYLRYNNGGFASVYAHDLSEAEKATVRNVIREEAELLGFWEGRPWGEILEDRGSQITFSGLGQHAPRETKHAWDPDSEKRTALRSAVAARLPSLEVRLGGSTSIDVTRSGIDKAYGIRNLSSHTGIALSEMLFFGDRLDKGGNDYPVLAIGVPSLAVKSWTETADELDTLLRLL